MWFDLCCVYFGDEYVVKICDKEICMQFMYIMFLGIMICKVVLLLYEDDGEVLCWLMCENVLGSFLYIVGVFVFKCENEDLMCMFVGEGDVFCINWCFKFVFEGMDVK